MSDFLTRLAQRQLGALGTIEPRVTPLYAPKANDLGVQSISENIEHQPAPQAPIVDPGILPSQLHEMLSRANNRPPKDRSYLYEPVRTESQLNQDRLFKTQVTPWVPSKSLSNQQGDDLCGQQSEPGESGASPNKKRLFATITNTTPVTPIRLANSTEPDSTSLTYRQNHLTAPAALGLREDPRHNSAQRVQEAPVHVTIGRIEVTAVTTAAAPKRAPAPRQQGMSLDEYLSRRQRREK
jgi:hypothetical protein